MANSIWQRSDESPAMRGLNAPAKEGRMSKEEMKEYIKEKLDKADYISTEIIYGLILGLFSE